VARIEHRRNVRTPAVLHVAGEPHEGADQGADADGEALPEAPDRALDRLTWLGWVSAGVAIGWLFLQLRALLEADAFAETRRLDTVLAIVRALAGAAALALPAGLEVGVERASRRVPWIYRAAVLLAVAQVATIVLGQARDRFLTDVDLTDPSQPAVLAYGIAALAPAIATIGGMWALSDGLWDVGARPSRLILRLVGGAAILVVLLTYVPYLNQLFSTDAVLISALNVLRLAISLGLIGITAVAGTHLLAGAVGSRTPRLAWAFAGVAGACYVLGTFGQAVIGVPFPQDVLLGLSYAVFALDSAAPILLLLAFATGLARSGSLPVPARRLVGRWVRYPAA
jgi:hypothetical protein